MAQRATGGSGEATHLTHPGDEATPHKLRGALIVAGAAVALVVGAYMLVTMLAGPEGLLTHMTASASTEMEGRTQQVWGPAE
jgi:hypothetical protein